MPKASIINQSCDNLNASLDVHSFKLDSENGHLDTKSHEEPPKRKVNIEETKMVLCMKNAKQKVEKLAAKLKLAKAQILSLRDELTK